MKYNDYILLIFEVIHFIRTFDPSYFYNIESQIHEIETTLFITTKSKKNLKSILDDYHKNYEPYQPVEVTPDIDRSKIWVK